MCLLYGGAPGGQGKLEDHHALSSAKCQVCTSSKHFWLFILSIM
jgi:hypothetical protein